jgi:hypothetical protein
MGFGAEEEVAGADVWVAPPRKGAKPFDVLDDDEMADNEDEDRMEDCCG